MYRFGFFHQYRNPASLLPNTKRLAAYNLVNRQILHEVQHLQSDSVHLLRALLYQLLVLLNRAYASENGLQNDTYVHPVFFRFRALLETHYITNHRVVDYLQ